LLVNIRFMCSIISIHTEPRRVFVRHRFFAGSSKVSTILQSSNPTLLIEKSNWTLMNADNADFPILSAFICVNLRPILKLSGN
jgi:hypothetical protein